MLPDRETIARLIDPTAWEDLQPIPDSYAGDPDAEEKQALYEKFFWTHRERRRKPSLEAADRVLEYWEDFNMPGWGE